MVVRGGSVKHDARIIINEKGSKAAAVTSDVELGDHFVRPLDISFNRPFLFLVRNRTTNTIIMLGRVVKP